MVGTKPVLAGIIFIILYNIQVKRIFIIILVYNDIMG
jgi:hypothetical protein